MAVVLCPPLGERPPFVNRLCRRILDLLGHKKPPATNFSDEGHERNYASAAGRGRIVVSERIRIMRRTEQMCHSFACALVSIEKKSFRSSSVA